MWSKLQSSQQVCLNMTKQASGPPEPNKQTCPNMSAHRLSNMFVKHDWNKPVDHLNQSQKLASSCAYFHSNSSPAQHSQIGHPLPSPAKQTKTRKKTLLITQPPPAEFFYDDVHPASGPRSSRWGLKCSNKCSDVTYPPCHQSCDTQQKPCVMLTVSSINPAWDHFK